MHAAAIKESFASSAQRESQKEAAMLRTAVLDGALDEAAFPAGMLEWPAFSSPALNARFHVPVFSASQYRFRIERCRLCFPGGEAASCARCRMQREGLMRSLTCLVPIRDSAARDFRFRSNGASCCGGIYSASTHPCLKRLASRPESSAIAMNRASAACFLLQPHIRSSSVIRCIATGSNSKPRVKRALAVFRGCEFSSWMRS